jgi:Phage tail lysozyme
MNVYEIATRITMINGASSVLAVIAKEVLTLEGGVERLNRALSSTRTLLAVGGGLSIAGGIGLLTGLKAVTEQAKGLTHELTQIKKLGVTPEEYERYRSAAFSMPSRVAGVTSADALKVLSTSHSMFGVEGSIKILEPLLKFQQVLGNTLGDYDKAGESMKQMIRAAEISGQFVNESTHKVDPDKVSKFLELGTKVAAATHGMVGPQAWLNMAQQGGPMLSTMSEEGLLTMAMVSQAMGGHRAGTALQALGREFLGLKMTTPTAEALDALGFFKSEPYTDKAGRVRNAWTTNRDRAGGPWSETGKEFVNSLQEDPLKAAGVLMGALNAHGFNNMKDIIPMLYKIMGTDTARRIEHELLRNMPQMFDERGRVKKGLGLNASANVQSEDYEQVEHNYEAAKNEMLSQLGLPLMKFAIPIMEQFTKTMLKFSEWAQANGPTIEKIGIGIGVLGTVMIGAGVAAILAAIGPTGWLVLGIGAFGVAFQQFPHASLDNLIKAMTTDIPNGVKDMLRAFDVLWAKIKDFAHSILTLGGLLGGGSGGSYADSAERMRNMSALGGGGPGFQAVAPQLMTDLQKDYGLTKEQAAGIIGNLGHESSGFTTMQEGNPIRGKGGWGWAQWTGPRRREFMDYAASHGFGTSSYAANYGMLKHDLDGRYHDALLAVKGSSSAHEAMMQFERRFENAGIKAYGSRATWTRRALGIGAPPKSDKHVQINTDIHLDGRKIAQAVSQHVAQLHEHSTQSPYFGGRRMFTGPDAQFAVG